MEFINRVKELVRPSSAEQKKIKETKKVVEDLLKSLEQELKSKGLAGVLYYSDRDGSSLYWDLRFKEGTFTVTHVKGDFVSKGVKVLVNSRAEAVVKFSIVHKWDDNSITPDWRNLELTPEYSLMMRSPSYLDQEFEEAETSTQSDSSWEPSLNNKIRLAMRLAEYQLDGRFERN